MLNLIPALTHGYILRLYMFSFALHDWNIFLMNSFFKLCLRQSSHMELKWRQGRGLLRARGCIDLGKVLLMTDTWSTEALTNVNKGLRREPHTDTAL